jgi:hypothetical protein
VAKSLEQWQRETRADLAREHTRQGQLAQRLSLLHRRNRAWYRTVGKQTWTYDSSQSIYPPDFLSINQGSLSFTSLGGISFVTVGGHVYEDFGLPGLAYSITDVDGNLTVDKSLDRAAIGGMTQGGWAVAHALVVPHVLPPGQYTMQLWLAFYNASPRANPSSITVTLESASMSVRNQ